MSTTTSTAPARRMPVPPPPRRARRWITLAVAVVATLALHWLAFHETQFDFGELASGTKGIWHFFFGDSRTAGALPPDHSWATIKPGFNACLVTLSMGLLGTTLSIPAALVLAFLGSRTTMKNVVVYQLARTLMSFFRAVPSFVWGLIFVTAVGLGAFPGVLAIITHNMGVMGKLWSEAMEEVEQGPVEALESAGASAVQRAAHVVAPSVMPQFLSLFLYRVDVNIRDSLTLGVVGAGGVGFLITTSIQEFQFSVMTTYVVMVLIMIIAIDMISAWLRKRLSA